MPRPFRLYGKKRGDRWTGSPFGSYGEALFHGALLLVGVAGLYAMVDRWVLPQWEANRGFIESDATVEALRISPQPQTDNPLYRPEVKIDYLAAGQRRTQWTYDINNVYSYSEEEAQSILNEFEVGAHYRCWYDPEDVGRVVLVRIYHWWMWLLLILPGSLALSGAIGLVRTALHFGTSAERRAAMADRASRFELFEGDQTDPKYPGVPRIQPVTNSPGTRLAYRLPVDITANWALAGIMAITIVWNMIAFWFAIVAVRNEIAGEGDWRMILFLVPLVIGGVILIHSTGRRMLIVAGLGATRLEISDHPLFPDETYSLLLWQYGRRRINSLRVKLICSEEATYRQGTDTRVERREVFERRLYLRTKIDLGPGAPFEELISLTMPSDVMHSFKAPHNEIKWQLVVSIAVRRFADYERRFPLVVYPAAPRKKVV